MSTLRVTILAIWVCSLHLVLRCMGVNDLYGSALVVAALPAASRISRGWTVALALTLGVVLCRASGTPQDVVPVLGLLCVGLVTIEVCRRSRLETNEEPREADVTIDVAEREMHRSRRHGRPISVVVFRGADREFTDSERSLVAEAIAKRTNGADVVLPHERSIVLLLPETRPDGAASATERLLAELRESGGVPLRTGIAGFPDEEITLSGLLNRARARARGEEPQRTEDEPPRSDAKPDLAAGVLTNC